MTETWLCWLYQYGIGGVVFFGTLGLAISTGALRWTQRRDRRLLVVLVAGFFAFLAIHGIWIVATQ